MDHNDILEFLDNYIVNYGDAEVILRGKRTAEDHYTDFSVADLIYALRTKDAGAKGSKFKTIYDCPRVPDDYYFEIGM